MGGRVVSSRDWSGLSLSKCVSCSANVVSNPQSSIASTSWSSVTREGSKFTVAAQFGSETETFSTPSSEATAEVTAFTQEWQVMPKGQ